MKSTLLSVSVLVGTACLASPPLHAITFTPNVFDDPTPVAAPNGCTGAGSNPTRCSLREAALSANANPGADVIELGTGTYTLSIPEAGNPESGDLDFSEGSPYGIAIQGQGPANTKILAAAGLNERILQVTGPDVSMTLQGLTLEGGNSPGDGGALFSDTGATVDADPVNILNCDFIGNKAAGDGGAVIIDGTNPTVVIDGGLYDNNESTGSNAGAIALSHGANISPLDLVKNVILTNNRAVNGQAGAIRHGAPNGVSFSNIQAMGNQAETGGAIYVSNGAGGIAFELLDSVISENVASTGDGGGIRGSGGGFFKIVNSTFSGNQAPANGGGAFINNGSGLQILGSAFNGNSAGNGGGLYHQGSGGTLKEITNSTFSGNEAGVDGGGLMILRSEFGFSLNNVTVADNSAAGLGGGVFGNPVLLRNSIFTANSSSGSSDDCSGINITSDGYNIFGSPNNADCEPDGFPIGNNPDDIVGDPLIGPLADNGGPTQTHNLLAGSPAIDGGNPGGCLDGSGAVLTTDQRGFLRPSGSACDIGSVEAIVTDLAIVKTADDEIYVVGDEITYTLTVTNNGPGISPAVVSDTLPSEVTLISVDAGCAESGGIVTCDLGDLDPGASAAASVVVEANNDGTVENTATVSGADVDTDPSNDSSSVTINVLSNDTDGGGCRIGRSASKSAAPAWGIFAIGLSSILWLRKRPISFSRLLIAGFCALGFPSMAAAQSADISIEKTASDEIVIVGDSFIYTLTVTNHGPDGSVATITDVLPSEVAFRDADAGCADIVGTVTCALGTIAAGESVTVNLTVEAINDGIADNTATVLGAFDGNSDNNSSTVSVEILSDDTGGGGDGGCRLGPSTQPGFIQSWAIFGILTAAGFAIRRRWN
ncbi:MAG TPA: choice-of-anchor Q domain-containing protein [bacterium]|nr:choice-of-anchor Q domain-containing protein [bacterium]